MREEGERNERWLSSTHDNTSRHASEPMQPSPPLTLALALALQGLPLHSLETSIKKMGQLKHIPVDDSLYKNIFQVRSVYQSLIGNTCPLQIISRAIFRLNQVPRPFSTLAEQTYLFLPSLAISPPFHINHFPPFHNIHFSLSRQPILFANQPFSFHNNHFPFFHVNHFPFTSTISQSHQSFSLFISTISLSHQPVSPFLHQPFSSFHVNHFILYINHFPSHIKTFPLFTSPISPFTSTISHSHQPFFPFTSTIFPTLSPPPPLDTSLVLSLALLSFFHQRLPPLLHPFPHPLSHSVLSCYVQASIFVPSLLSTRTFSFQHNSGRFLLL